MNRETRRRIGKMTKQNPAMVSRKLTDAEQRTDDAAIEKKAERLNEVANEIHEILIREDLTPNDMQMIFRVLGDDLQALTNQTKLSKLYGRESTSADERSGEGSEEGGEREGDGGSASPSGSAEGEG